MKVRPISRLFLLITLAALACTKNSDITEVKIAPGNYYLSNTVNFDAPKLFAKQYSTLDTNIIRSVLTRFVYEPVWADAFQG